MRSLLILCLWQAWLIGPDAFLVEYRHSLTVLFQAQLGGLEQFWEVDRAESFGPISQMRTKAEGGRISGPSSTQ